MAVVINDFEVVPAPQPAQPQLGQPQRAQPQPSPTKQAADLDRQLARHHERAARVRAH